jgi:hypothetical protein
MYPAVTGCTEGMVWRAVFIGKIKGVFDSDRPVVVFAGRGAGEP